MRVYIGNAEGTWLLVLLPHKTSELWEGCRKVREGHGGWTEIPILHISSQGPVITWNLRDSGSGAYAEKWWGHLLISRLAAELVLSVVPFFNNELFIAKKGNSAWLSPAGFHTELEKEWKVLTISFFPLPSYNAVELFWIYLLCISAIPSDKVGFFLPFFSPLCLISEFYLIRKSFKMPE